jgi:hypothetical protein
VPPVPGEPPPRDCLYCGLDAPPLTVAVSRAAEP